MANTTYSPVSLLNTTIIAYGIPAIGTASGNFCTVTSDFPVTTQQTEIDGSLQTNLVAANTATMMLRMQLGNPTLSILRQAATTVKTFGTFLPSSVVVLSGSGGIISSVFSANSHVTKYPPLILAQEASNQTIDVEVKFHNAIWV